MALPVQGFSLRSNNHNHKDNNKKKNVMIVRLSRGGRRARGNKKTVMVSIGLKWDLWSKRKESTKKLPFQLSLSYWRHCRLLWLANSKEEPIFSHIACLVCCSYSYLVRDSIRCVIHYRTCAGCKWLLSVQAAYYIPNAQLC